MGLPAQYWPLPPTQADSDDLAPLGPLPQSSQRGLYPHLQRREAAPRPRKTIDKAKTLGDEIPVFLEKEFKKLNTNLFTPERKKEKKKELVLNDMLGYDIMAATKR